MLMHEKSCLIPIMKHGEDEDDDDNNDDDDVNAYEIKHAVPTAAAAVH